VPVPGTGQPSKPPPRPPFEPDMQSFAESMRALREWANLTLEALQLPTSTSSVYLRGERFPPSKFVDAFVTRCLEHGKPHCKHAIDINIELRYWQTAWAHAKRKQLGKTTPKQPRKPIITGPEGTIFVPSPLYVRKNGRGFIPPGDMPTVLHCTVGFMEDRLGSVKFDPPTVQPSTHRQRQSGHMAQEILQAFSQDLEFHGSFREIRIVRVVPVVQVVPGSDQWPINVQITVMEASWPTPRTFEVPFTVDEFAAEDTGATSSAKVARSLAIHALRLIEGQLAIGPVRGIKEVKP
jgi:hypothetical protein